MIVVWGERDDTPVGHVLDALQARGKLVLHIDTAALARLRYDIDFGAMTLGWIELDGRRMSLESLVGWYVRPAEATSEAALASSGVLMALAATMPGCVINRPASNASNASKPYQLVLIEACGFEVPPTLVTSDVDMARDFLRRHGRVVYKSISGVRSIVASLREGDPRIEAIGHGPVQFQRHIEGTDVRVHVVGTRWFAVEIESEADDYRYAARAGTSATLKPIAIPRALGERLVALTRRLGLLVAGIDLRRTPDDRWVCFEVNPSPGFSYYEDATGQPIAAAIARLLCSPEARVAAKPRVAGGAHGGRSSTEKTNARYGRS